MDRYDPQAIEPKWQQVWEAEQAFQVTDEPVQPKSYVLEQLPYPSGTLHMGHMLVYTIGDVQTHFRRRSGAHVMHPMGFDSFGLPAENAAIREGGATRARSSSATSRTSALDRRIGWAIDWSRELSTHDPRYYRWQQWPFLHFLERGIAYRKAAPVKWCPNDQTVLANEQVLPDGRCERCGALVESRLMEQWFFRITDYAQALLDDLETLDWPESIKARQRNWIGRSDGAEISFRVAESISTCPSSPRVRTRSFGATFFVLAPEHELVAAARRPSKPWRRGCRNATSRRRCRCPSGSGERRDVEKTRRMPRRAIRLSDCGARRNLMLDAKDPPERHVAITSAGSGSDLLALWTIQEKKIDFTRVPVGGGGWFSYLPLLATLMQPRSIPTEASKIAKLGEA